jgi:NADPH:quinone reductase-like Zn-dependent oxidoreductase
MKAVEFSRHGGPEVLELVDRPAPAAAPGEVLVEVHAVSVNPVDAKLRAGAIPQLKVELPSGTGRDGAGVVLEAGDPALKGRAVGFVVPRGAGAWTERLALPADLVAPLPEGLEMAEAASLPLAGISAQAVLFEAAQVAPGDRVLVHAAAGGVGSLAVQIARAAGAEVWGTCSALNADFVAGLGATPLPYDREDFSRALSGLDLVVDLMGGEVHAHSYAVLRPGGTIAALNAAPFEDRGAEFGVSVRVAQVIPTRAKLEALFARVADGTLRPVLTDTLRFAEFAEAHRRIETGHTRGKIVLTLR